MSFFSELKRRNVIRMAVLYAVGAWLILQVTELLVDILDVPDWSMRFVLMILILGFPFALIFSWVYEMTPEGLKKESEVAEDASVTAATARKLNVVVIFLLVAVLATFVVDRLVPERASETEAAVEGDTSTDNDPGVASDAATLPAESSLSLAVLPFVNLSSNADNEYFSDGLTETLLHILAQIPELKVAARTSSFSFKGKNEDVRTIATTLGVANVLEGSVQRAGDRVRITAQLIRAEDGFHIWSENYDRTLDDIFAIQDEIATAVGRALTTSLLGNDLQLKAATTTNVQAYEFYLQALAEYRKASFQSLQNAETLLQRALELDPQYVDALAALAAVYQWQVNTGSRPFDEGSNQVVVMAERALAISPENIEAAVLLERARAQLANQAGDFSVWGEMAGRYAALVARAPGEVAPKVAYADVLSQTGQTNDALLQLQRALELDPLNPEVYLDLGNLYIESIQDYETARTYLRKSLELESQQPNAYAALGRADIQDGNFGGFIENFEIASDLDPLDPELPGANAELLYNAGLVDYATPYHERVRSIAPNSAYAQRLQLQREVALKNDEGIIIAAKAMIDADVPNRRGAWVNAVLELMVASQRLGMLDEAVAFVQARYPAFRTADAEQATAKVRNASRRAAIFFAADMSPEELQAAADAELRMIEETDRDTSNFWPLTRVRISLFQGRVDEAIEVARGIVSEGEFALPNDWVRRQAGFAFYAPLLEDEEVRNGLARLDAGFEARKAELVRYFEVERG